MIITTKDINGEAMIIKAIGSSGLQEKMEVSTDVVNFIKQVGRISKVKDSNQTLYGINHITFILEGSEEVKILFPKQYSFLEDKFLWDEKHEAFKSKKKQLGCSTGDDRNLFIDTDSSGTLIWWRNSRGQEDTIFDGKELKTEEEFNQVFKLLDIKNLFK